MAGGFVKSRCTAFPPALAGYPRAAKTFIRGWQTPTYVQVRLHSSLFPASFFRKVCVDKQSTSGYTHSEARAAILALQRRMWFLS
jgi:hypothetical protein